MYVLCTNRTRGPDGASHQRPSRACQPSRTVQHSWTVQPERGQCNQSVHCATRPHAGRSARLVRREAMGGSRSALPGPGRCNGRRGWLLAGPASALTRMLASHGRCWACRESEGSRTDSVGSRQRRAGTGCYRRLPPTGQGRGWSGGTEIVEFSVRVSRAHVWGQAV